MALLGFIDFDSNTHYDSYKEAGIGWDQKKLRQQECIKEELTNDHVDNRLLMSGTEFQDALAICYRQPMPILLEICSGSFRRCSILHALIFKKSGIIYDHHESLQETVLNLISHVYTDCSITVWPELAQPINQSPGLIGDLGFCDSLWTTRVWS